MCLLRHSAHLGRTGVQMVCPKPTNRWFTSAQSSRGSQASSCKRVCSGSLVDFFSQARRFDMRCTCVSTPIPVIFFQAVAMQMWPIFGPTPGSFKSSTIVSGISWSYLSMSIFAVCFKYFALFCRLKGDY